MKTKFRFSAIILIIFALIFAACSGDGANSSGVNNDNEISEQGATTKGTLPGWVNVGSAGFTVGGAWETRMAIDPLGTPYIVYTGENAEVIVMKYTETSWVDVSSTDLGDGGETSISIDTSNISYAPYVAYRDSSNGRKVTVMRYDGTNWVNVGSAGFSATSADYINIAIDSSGRPYVAYNDEANYKKATVMKYDGSSWSEVDSETLNTIDAYHPSIVIDSSEMPYIVHENSGDSRYAHATVMKYNGSNWIYVGMPNFSAGFAESTRIAIDSTDTPYVVYKDWANSGKATVMKYNGTNWVNVGSAGFSAGQAQYPEIAIDSTGTPYVLYQDGANSWKATVMKYNGTNWVNVGSAGFSAGEVFWLSIALDPSNIPYVVYMDDANSGKATVMKYDSIQSINLGSTGFSEGTADSTSIAVDPSGTPCIAFSDGANSYRATVMKYNGSSWNILGTAGFSDGTAWSTDIAIDSLGNTYVAYEDWANFNKATVMKYNGSSWQPVVNAGISESTAYFPRIVVDSSGNLYVAYEDWAYDSKATVMKYTASTNTWGYLGIPGLSDDYAYSPGITLDASGVPYVVYMDYANEFRATVKKYNESSDTWDTVGNPGFSDDFAEYLNLAVDSSGTPYVIYSDFANSYKTTVMKFDSNSSEWVYVGTPGFSNDYADFTSIAISPSGAPFVAFKDYDNSNMTTIMKFNGTNWDTISYTGTGTTGQADYIDMAIDNLGIPYVVYSDSANSYKATVLKVNVPVNLNLIPINIELSGQVASYDEGETMTITASSPGETETISYTWYLNNVEVATGDTYTTSSSLSSGTYQIDVIAVNDLGNRTGSLTYYFQILIAPSSEKVVYVDPTATGTGDGKTWANAYTSLETAEANERADLVSLGLPIVFKCRGGEDLCNVSFLKENWTTDQDHNITIEVDPENMHDGTRGTGYVLKGIDPGSHVLGIYTDYTLVKNISIDGSMCNPYRHGIMINGTAGCVFKNILVYDAGSSGITMTNGEDAIIINSIIYNSGSNGLYSSYQKLSIYNLTVLNNGNSGIYHEGNWVATMSVVNSYSGGNANGDFTYVNSGSMELTNCISSDTTGNSQAALSTDTGAMFVNVTPGSEDAHIKAGSGLIDAGSDLSNDSIFPFDTDFEGQLRDNNWDVGVDEY